MVDGNGMTTVTMKGMKLPALLLETKVTNKQQTSEACTRRMSTKSGRNEK